jgi:hypothetical protein
MPLFVQLDLAMLRIPKLKGLLQFSYCNAADPLCEVECQSWKQNDKTMLLRIVVPGRKACAVEMPDFPAPLATKAIQPGPKKVDLPASCDADAIFGIKDAPDRTLAGDKLGGWPAWVQDAEWPQCADCAERMVQVVQLESNGSVGHQWGDMGRAYIFLCEDHPSRVGFVWQGH